VELGWSVAAAAAAAVAVVVTRVWKFEEETRA
jgi:hypothetical protein